MKNTILILWPLPIWLLVAKKVLEEQKTSIDDCEIIPAGKNLILGKLTNIKERSAYKNIKTINILIPYITEEESRGIKKTLTELTKNRHTRIHWFTPVNEKGIRKTCKGIPGVEHHCDVLAEALESDLSRNLDRDSKSQKPPTYDDFLRYKITRSFLGDANGRFDSNQLAEGLKGLSLTKKEFIQKHKNSLTNYTKSYPAIEGRSPLITNLKKELHRLAKADDISVLLSGETGTGKEAIAFFLHDLSPRREKPYGTINCAGFHEELLHSTLFGHKKGAFTGAASNNPGLLKSLEGGTIFLDELPDMPIKVQAMFLRFLEDGTFIPLGGTHEDEQYADIRVIGAAQPDLLKHKFKNNQFRKDLYFRIAEKNLTVPPLRQLKGDFLYLVTHLTYKIGREDPRERYCTINFFTS
ncbi:MAG: sigma-54 factor interaction domain-containing protein, partial [Desulfobacterales bacterium]|nr:sigma-54 factor interaction domain-containing protein [Desulfobacterales bacterium]